MEFAREVDFELFGVQEEIKVQFFAVVPVSDSWFSHGLASPLSHKVEQCQIHSAFFNF